MAYKTMNDSATTAGLIAMEETGLRRIKVRLRGSR